MFKVNSLFQCNYLNRQDFNNQKIERKRRQLRKHCHGGEKKKINQWEHKKWTCRKRVPWPWIRSLLGETIIVFPMTEYCNICCSFLHKWLFLPAWFCNQNLPESYLPAPSLAWSTNTSALITEQAKALASLLKLCHWSAVPTKMNCAPLKLGPSMHNWATFNYRNLGAFLAQD